MSNPVLSPNTFSNKYMGGASIASNDTMTMNGTIGKTAILLALVVASAIYPWHLVNQAVVAGQLNQAVFAEQFKTVNILMIVGCIGGLIFALITSFKPNFSPVTAPIYAVFKGVALGAISAIYNIQSQGIALQALMLTIAVLCLMLFLYRTKIIQVTDKFKMVVICATGAIMLLYLVSFVLSFFSISIPFLHGSGWISIGVSLAIVVVAALNLALDFDLIEQGTNAGAPKYMEWYGGFALLVTLVWLYLEILRLLSKLKGRD